MKKIFFLLMVSLLFIGCSNDGDSNNSGNNNSNTGKNVDYEFTITINGEVHKVKGNTANGDSGPSNNPYFYSNTCVVSNSGGQAIMHLKINDVTANNYISGQNMTCMILFGNLLLGTNQATVIFQGQHFDDLCTSLGAFNFTMSGFQTTSAVNNSGIQDNKLPITVTDLGTPSTTLSNFGNTLKGNYSGTIYLQNKLSPYHYNIPVQLSIDFKAVRLN